MTSSRHHYRDGTKMISASRVLKIEHGPTPKITGNAEGTKMVTRPVYRKPYEV